MTKEQRDNYKGELTCRTCKYKVPVGKTSPKRIYPDYSITKCKVCEWIYKHKQDITELKENIIISDDEILEYLHFIYFDKSFYLNDIALKLNKTLEELMSIYSYLHVANKKVRIKYNCEYCGKESSDPFEAYKTTLYHYCSHECYYKDKTNKIPKGENNQFYNRLETKCTNCEKPIKIIPSKNQTINSFGDNHHFCSLQCYWNFRGKYYYGEKTGSYHREKTPEEKDKHRQFLLSNLQNDDRLDTSIQLKINNILDDNNIKYKREEIFGYYSVDNYLVDYNGIIEVMGDYWHCSPLRYNENSYKINLVQQKQLNRDKIKYSYIINHYNINILYLWETDINKNFELCNLLIKKYIENNNILENYHSFNWEIKNGQLSLCKNLITPYQDLSIDNYRYLIK